MLPPPLPRIIIQFAYFTSCKYERTQYKKLESKMPKRGILGGRRYIYTPVFLITFFKSYSAKHGRRRASRVSPTNSFKLIHTTLLRCLSFSLFKHNTMKNYFCEENIAKERYSRWHLIRNTLPFSILWKHNRDRPYINEPRWNILGQLLFFIENINYILSTTPSP